MKISKNELIEKYVKTVRNSVMNFDWKVQTSITLMNFFKSKEYEFFFSPKIKKKDGDKCLDRTPDFQARKSKRGDILGEIKQSLPNPNGDSYDRKVIKDIEQLKEYAGELMGISTPHDVFFASSSICNEAIKEYVKKIDSTPETKGKVIVLKYHWVSGGSHNRLAISKIYGDFSDGDINEEFSYKDYMVGEGDLEQIQGYYKILYTEENTNDTPVEYMMMILWHNIIPELIQSSNYEKTIERIRKGQNTLKFEIEQVMPILDELYTIRRSEEDIASQFNKEMIIKALDGFVKLNKVKKLNDSETNPEYQVTHQKIAHQKEDLLDYLIRELHKEEFEKRADVEIQKLTNRDLGSIESAS